MNILETINSSADVKKIPEEQLHREISRELFERDYTLIEAELEEYRQRK